MKLTNPCTDTGKKLVICFKKPEQESLSQLENLIKFSWEVY